ncbi:hypothetical protein FSP39_021402 [Pinctada imbricata]|uniref:WD repeat and coiled-coil-containing protein n=1 Tax=Pinctada imbricata TaxID=66713 RepID=A0AA88Y5R9_PINIB|nr:hypothetical protein FSP39_021402 [Pinctada imbricata]
MPHRNTVKSVHWSCDIGPATCYMCVVLPQHVSIWKVDGSVPKLTFKQVRKLNVQPIPQGCLWNPSRDILCILSRQQCNFFFRHTHNRGSYAFPPLESGKISCGTWSEDGTKLILCVGAIILVYSWPEIDVSISNFTPAAWRIPQLDGTIRAIKSLSVDALVCAAEIPLESLCKNQDSFSVSASQDTSIMTLDGSDDSLMIVPKKRQPSIKDTLLNLPRNPESLIQDSCQLVTVLLREGRDPQKRSCVGVAGLLTPEVLAFDHEQKVVIVGSNTQNVLQVFRLDGGIKGHLVKATEVILDKSERPKGLACLHPSMVSGQKGILVATATKAPGDATFLPSPSGQQSKISLQFFPVNLPEVHAQSNGKLNHSLESGETSSLSSIDSPRHRIRVMNSSDMESDDQISPREVDSNLSDVQTNQSDSDCKTPDTQDSEKDEKSQHATDNMEVVLTKQTTITQLCDQSDLDSEASPREITLSTSDPTKEKAGIVDLEKGSGESSSDLETETVEFSEQTPKFASNEFTENLPEDIQQDHPKVLEERLSSKSGSSVRSSPPSSSKGSRPASQETESLVSLVESTDGRSRPSSQDVDRSRPLIQEIDSATVSSKDEDNLSTASQKDGKVQQEEAEKLALLEEQLALQVYLHVSLTVLNSQIFGKSNPSQLY